MRRSWQCKEGRTFLQAEGRGCEGWDTGGAFQGHGKSPTWWPGPVGRNNECWRGGWRARALGSGNPIFQCVTLQWPCGWRGSKIEKENLPMSPKVCIPQTNSTEEELNIKCTLQNHWGILPFFLPASPAGFCFFFFNMKSGGRWVTGDHRSLPGPHISPGAAELKACQGFQAEYKLHRQAKLFICSWVKNTPLRSPLTPGPYHQGCL